MAANDDYARSVADAAAATAESAGTPIVARSTYDLTVPDSPAVMTQLETARPDVVILASHIPDGVAFRRAMLASDLHVGALIGSTMAECDPDFAGDLGPDAVGIFASDRPTGGFQPSALDPAARALYDRFAAAWASRSGGRRSASTARLGDPAASPPEYTITGPSDAGSAEAGPSEEGLSGFSAAWALFHDVLPAASRRARSTPSHRRGGPLDRPSDRIAAERRRAPLLRGSGDARPERAGGGRHLAVAGGPVLHLRLAADLSDRARSRSCRWLDDGDRAPTAGRIVRPARSSAAWRHGRAAVGGDRPGRRRRGRDRVRLRRRPARRRRAGGWRPVPERDRRSPSVPPAARSSSAWRSRRARLRCRGLRRPHPSFRGPPYDPRRDRRGARPARRAVRRARRRLGVAAVSRPRSSSR